MPKDMHGVMSEFKRGELHSGSKHGPKVTSRKQAIAIGLSEQRQQGKSIPPKKTAKSKSRRRSASGSFDGPPASPGMGAFSTRPRPIKAPKTLAGRRAASHAAAY